MEEQDKISELQNKLMDEMLSWDKLPPELKHSTLEYMAFRRELTKESDRGSALLAAAHLDFMLEKLLKKKLLGNKSHYKKLFDFTGPLGTFSSKILLSYSLGLISADALYDIQIIREIRNKFGHSLSIIGFDTPEIKSKCDKLKHNVRKENASPRSKFLNVVSSLSGQIEAETNQCEKFKEQSGLDLRERKEKFDKIMSVIQSSLKPGK